MTPISLTNCVEYEPDLYILPVEYYYPSASLGPQLYRWWQWFPASGGSERPEWKLVTAIGV